MQAFAGAGIDPVCWTVAVRRMMLLLSKGMVRTAHRVLEDFVSNEQISNCEGPIDPEYCQWMDEEDGQPAIVRIAPQAIEQTGDTRFMTNEDRVLAAIELLAESPDQCVEVIDRKIAEHQAALDRYQALRRTIVGKPLMRAKTTPAAENNVDSKVDSKGGRAYVPKDWSDEVSRIREYLEANGPSKPAMIGGSVGLTPIAVGLAIKSEREVFDKDGYGRVFLVA